MTIPELYKHLDILREVTDKLNIVRKEMKIEKHDNDARVIADTYDTIMKEIGYTLAHEYDCEL